MGHDNDNGRVPAERVAKKFTKIVLIGPRPPDTKESVLTLTSPSSNCSSFTNVP